MRCWLIAVFCFACANIVTANGTSERYVKQYCLSTGYNAVVAEGDLEPRSIGSYTVRIYSSQQKEHPTDDFICGIVQARQGTVENTVFADVDQDGVKEIIVTMRSAGTGGYLAADAFSFKDNRLTRVGSVSDLPKEADCVSALVNVMKNTSDRLPGN